MGIVAGTRQARKPIFMLWQSTAGGFAPPCDAKQGVELIMEAIEIPSCICFMRWRREAVERSCISSHS